MASMPDDPLTRQDLQELMARGGGGPPAIDPSELTTQATDKLRDQLRREASEIERNLRHEIRHRGELTDEKIARLTDQVTSLGALTAEKFSGVDKQFDLGEASRIELSSQAQIALAAALATSEKALDKAQNDTEKRIEQLRLEGASGQSVRDVQFTDMKERLSRVESIRQGGKDAYQGLYLALSAVLAAVTIAAILFALLKP